MGKNGTKKDLNTLDSVGAINWKQTIIAIILIVAMAMFANHLTTKEGDMPLFLVTGLMLGYVLSRSRYGFAGGVKRIYMTGEGSLTRALLVMFGLTMIGFAGIHYTAAKEGAVVAYKAMEGDAIIPGSGFVQPADLSKIIGGFIFGIGMILGGGCASGTLTDSGEGEGRAWITVVFFAIGGMIGHGLLPWWNESGPGKIEGITLYLPDAFGYVGAVIVSFIGLLILYGIAQSYENKRRKAGTVKEEVWEGTQKRIDSKDVKKLFSKEAYHKLFVERWTFMTGGIFIAVLAIFMLTTTGTSWGASGPYTNWGLWVLDKIGMAPTGEAFEGALEGVRKGLMHQGVSVRNIGIITGAAISMLLAGRFKFNFDFTMKDVGYYALGGILMGIGAKIGSGCNVGALYSGMANFSLSGWVFMISLALGGIVGLKLFEGKVNIVPDRKIK